MTDTAKLKTVPIGRRTEFRKTISESDVYLFAGITGDFDPLHIDAEYCRSTAYGQRIVHGAFVIGMMMTAASLATRDVDAVVPSLGFDRVRHTGPVFFGDTLTVDYRFTSLDAARHRGEADITVTNQRDETVAVARHVYKLL